MKKCLDTVAKIELLRGQGQRCVFVAYGKDALGVAESILESTVAENECVCLVMSEKRKRSGGPCPRGSHEAWGYQACDQLLGRTYKAVVLQDFSLATPNTILKVVETVSRGGAVILLFEEVVHRKELLTLRGKHGPSLYFGMFFRSLVKAEFAFCIKHRIAIGHAGAAAEKRLQLSEDQRRVRERILRGLEEGKRYRAIITGARGRGKSTILGAVVAALLMAGMPRILATGPGISSTRTFFECVETILAREGRCPSKTESSTGLCRRIFLDGAIVEYCDPGDVPAQGFDLLVVEEAAGMDQGVFEALVQAPRVVSVSSAGGYEGSAGGLERKVIGRQGLERILVTEPMRYSGGDLLGEWLKKVVLLDVECRAPGDNGDCRLFLVNKERLARRTGALRAFFSLFTQGHYKSSPNDLMNALDNPRAFLVALSPRKRRAEVLAAMQLVLEGGVVPDSPRDGNVVPWALHGFYGDESLLRASGVRVARIAVHPSLQRRGLGSLCLSLALKALSRTGLPSTQSQRLFLPFRHSPFPRAEYIGSCFSLAQEALMFWLKNGYRPFYIRKGKSRATGEHTIVTLRPLGPEPGILSRYQGEFRKRFLRSLRFSFCCLEPWLCLEILGGQGGALPTHFPDKDDKKRMRRFVQSTSDVYDVVDLVPAIAERFLFSHVPLGALERCVILMIGLQNRAPEDVLEFLGIRFSILRTVLSSVFRRVLSALGNEQEQTLF